MPFKKVAKNTSFIFAAQATNVIIQLVYTIIMARMLRIEDFGKFSFAFAFTQLFVVAIDLGINTFTVREISKDKEKANSLLTNGLLLKFFISVIVWVIIASIISSIQCPADTRLAVYILGFGLLIYSINASFIAVLQAFEKIDLVALNAVMFFMINVLLGTLFLFMGFGIVALALANFLAGIITLIIGYKLFCKYCFIPKLELNPSIWPKILKYSIPIGIGAIFFTIYSKIDVTLISLIKGDEQVAYYTAARRITGSLLIMSDAFFISVFPLMSSYLEKSSEHMDIIVKKGCRFMAMTSFFLAFSFYMLSPKIITLLYGTEYIEAAFALKIIAWSLLFSFMGNTFKHVLLSSAEGSKKFTIVAGVGTVINLLCNLILIPLFGILGAAMSALVTEMVVAVNYYIYTKKQGTRVAIWSALWKPLMAALIMAAFMWTFINSNLFLIIFFSAVLYFLLLIVFKSFEPDEIKVIKKIINLKE